MKKICHLVDHVLEGFIFKVYSKEILLFYFFSISARKDSPVVDNSDNHRENGRRSGRRSSSRSKSRKKSSKSTRSPKRRSRFVLF